MKNIRFKYQKREVGRLSSGKLKNEYFVKTCLSFRKKLTIFGTGILREDESEVGFCGSKSPPNPLLFPKKQTSRKLQIEQASCFNKTYKRCAGNTLPNNIWIRNHLLPAILWWERVEVFSEESYALGSILKFFYAMLSGTFQSALLLLFLLECRFT